MRRRQNDSMGAASRISKQSNIVSLVARAGVKIDSFADSTGKITDLFRPLTV